ncbi:MAG: hypothetical protein ABNO82_00225 [Candidatus Shikimatogenerans sp. Tder]|uniref:Uncharacterized protein n=1 Tax=Candidatus Shikimatogenerans sp. Tder TaxID=3158566 RepID=A0AAU7QS55_9FLAO
MYNILLNKYYLKYLKLYKKNKKYLLYYQYNLMKKKLLLLLNNNNIKKNKKRIGILINFFKIKNIIKKKKNLNYNKLNLILRKNYNNIGNIHILNIILNKIINIFLKLGYLLYEDNEIKNK